MKFGTLLQLKAIAEWRTEYLSYKKLKRIIKMLPNNQSSDEEPVINGQPTLPSKELGAVRYHNASYNELAAYVNMLDIELNSNAINGPLLDEPSKTISRVERAFDEQLEEDLRRINAHAASVLRLIEKRMALIAQQGTASVVRPSPASITYSRKQSAVDMALVRDTYCECAKLRSFIQLNHEGIRKIVKKLDKHSIIRQPERQPAMLERLAGEPFYVMREKVDASSVELERLCGHPEVVRRMRGDAKRACSPQIAVSPTPRLWACAASALLAAAIAALSPLLDPTDELLHPRRCLAVLACVITLWLTEALPYFVTAMLVPVLIVLFKVLPEEPATDHQASSADPITAEVEGGPLASMAADESAKLLISSMFGSSTILLVLAGLVAAAVVSRCQLELRLAIWLCELFGRYPMCFLHTIMQLGLVLSMCISNVTAPILLLSVVQPLLREMPSGCRYAKALLLGLAFSCNLGGMLTPIASPQNAVALQALSSVGATISFGAWLSTALPIAEIGVLLVYGLLLLLLRPFDCEELPAIFVDNKHKLTLKHGLMLGAVLTTTVLWAALSLPPLHAIFGDPAIVGLALVVLAFGSGFLSKDDFNDLAWHLLALIGGGNALGLAVSRSGLLTLVADALLDKIGGASSWILTVELVAAVLILTSFVSHTVAAIVTMPLIASIGNAAGEPARIVFCCALTCSAAMALPMSSFPNVNSLLAEDDYGRSYLSASDFLRVGLPGSIIVSLLAATLAFWLIGALLP